MSAKILEGPPLKFNGYEAAQTIGSFFFESAEKFSDRICQIDASDAEDCKQETYKSVKERSTRIAIELQHRGITNKDVIAFCSYNTMDNAIPLLGTLYLGAKVSNLDPTLSIEHTKYLISLIAPKIIFVIDTAVQLIEDSIKDTNLNVDIIVLGHSDKYTMFSTLLTPKENEEDFKPIKLDIHDDAFVFFTSGTTRHPKAICYDHYGFMNGAHMLLEAGFFGDLVFHFAPFYWMSGIGVLVNTFLTGGCRIFSRNINAGDVFRIIDTYKVTTILMSPLITYVLTRASTTQIYDISSISMILISGSRLRTSQFQKICDLFKDATTMFGYGLTEACMVSMFGPQDPLEVVQSKRGSTGRVMAGIQLIILDVETNVSVSAMKSGEICVKSPSLMKCYHNEPHVTVFDENGFFKTGDIGYYDSDGCLYIIDRITEIFTYLSHQIIPSLIEGVLHEHRAVQSAVVFGIPCGDDGEIPTACVVLHSQFDITPEELELFVAERVNDAERLRGGIIFVEDLPKSPSGKVMRREVRNSILQSRQ